MMISSDYYKRISQFEIISEYEVLNLNHAELESSTIYIKSNFAEHIFKKILQINPSKFAGVTFILHGEDRTISIPTALQVTSNGGKIKSVNWLGDSSIVEPIPIGIPTFDRLKEVSREDYALFYAELQEYSSKSGKRDIHLYANFDITTNLPHRRSALMAALRIKNSYSPFTRIGLTQNLEILSKSEFVLSPPGAGPDCFRTWEAMYLGAIPIVLRSHWPFGHLNLPVLVVNSFENLEEEIARYKKRVDSPNNSWEKYFRLS